MIMAIARVSRATVVYSDDQGIRRLGSQLDMRVIGIGQLDLPEPTLFDRT
jgi:hypothetical protein